MRTTTERNRIITTYRPLAMWALHQRKLASAVARLGMERAEDLATDALLATAARWDARVCTIETYLIRRVTWDVIGAARRTRPRLSLRLPEQIHERSQPEPRHLIDVDAAVRRLPARHRAVIEQRYYGQKLQKEVAADLGLHWTRISQIESEAIGQLREMLA